jgi:hypothetical protein
MMRSTGNRSQGRRDGGAGAERPCIPGRTWDSEDPIDLARAGALPFQPWAPGRRLEFVCIRSELVSGRRLIQPALAAAPN